MTENVFDKLWNSTKVFKNYLISYSFYVLVLLSARYLFLLIKCYTECIGKQEVGTYIYSLLYTHTGLLGWLHHEVLQPLMWRGHRWPLGPMKEASGAAICSSLSSALGLRHRLRPTTRHGRSCVEGGVAFSCTSLTADLRLVGPPEDSLRLRLRLSLVPGRTRPRPGGERLRHRINAYNVRRRRVLSLSSAALAVAVVSHTHINN